MITVCSEATVYDMNNLSSKDLSRDSSRLLTWLVFDRGHVLREEFSFELSVIFVLGKPAPVRKQPFLAERRAVYLDVLQVPRSAAAGVVVTDSAAAAVVNHSKQSYNSRLLG